ncbi:MAG: MATE family efflux transporter [Oscillospiraceae bacterium]|nr:MATE family efflux transporter [Oscillospiraceae bacterium]
MKKTNFTEGAILSPLLRFMLPVLFAMFLQAMYGAVDLLVVGQFATNADVSGVSTGSQIVLTLTNLIVSFAMGITVTVGQKIGQKRPDEASTVVGTGIVIFIAVGLIFTLISIVFAAPLASVMNAPEEAFDITVKYIRICGGGFLIVTAYNLIGSIFRGLGDSKTPLFAVGIACVINIIGDLIFVAVLGLGAEGAALATIAAQIVSVIVSLVIIAKKGDMPFKLTKDSFKFNMLSAKRIFKLGAPIALQDFLVGMSFLVLIAIVNNISLEASAGVGVAEKVCAFIMLVPSAFMQSMSSFVAQNIGARKPDRAKKVLFYGISVSFVFGVAMFLLTFFHGDIMSAIFSKEPDTVQLAFDYLKAYAIDCILTCFLFCFIGYFNGNGNTAFVMTQGIVGAFCIRIPVAFLMSHIGNNSLFLIGLATPCSTVVQIIMCFVMYTILRRKATYQGITD